MKFQFLLLFQFSWILSSFCKFVPLNSLIPKSLKNVWESPELQPALENLRSRYKGNMEFREKKFPRILDGKKAKYGDFPYYFLLELDNNYHCGGSLIKPYWILTVN